MSAQWTGLILKVNMLKFILAVEVCNIKCLTYKYFIFQGLGIIKKNKYRKRSGCMEIIPKMMNY